MSTRTLEGPVGSTESGTRIAAPELGLVESKLRPPYARPGLASRSALVDRLAESPAPIVTVVAPAGYGKTTVLGQWATRSPLPASWLSLDQYDDDPAVLLTYLVAALDRIGLIAPEVRGAMLAEAAVDTSWALRRLAGAVSSMGTPFLLVLDQGEVVRNPRCWDLIAALALHLPDGARLALASRSEPLLPMARLRAQGLTDEIRPELLVMDEADAGQLLAGGGVTVDAAAVRDLVARTEGWPVALYLAGLTMTAGGPTRPTGAPVQGDDRMVADYLRAEVLSALTPSMLDFLTRTSVLDQLSGSLCDAVLGATGSQRVLESLEESNLLLVPLDGQRHWFRCHRLLRELLAAELDRSGPELVSRLHDRAAAWFEANGQPDLAIDHAQAAGDADRAARLFGEIGQATYASGRADTAQRWLAWFDERRVIERYPHVAVLGALVESLAGHRAAAHLLADSAASGNQGGLAPDGSPLDSWVATMDACLCRQGVERMRDDAARSTSRLGLRSPLRGPAAFLEGLAALLQGDGEAADRHLATGAEICLRYGPTPTGAAAVAERAAIALDCGDWVVAGELSAEAVAVVTRDQLEAYVQSTVVYAVAARTAAQQGDVRRARGYVALAARVRPRCTAAIPWSAQFLIQLAHAYLALADPGGARAVLRQVRDILHTSPDLGVVADQCAALHQMLDTIRVGSVGASSLTAAELRLLPLLATHLSYRDIGERLHVSRNTIKSEAVSVFRKLGVSSRSDAVSTAEQIGLLGV